MEAINYVYIAMFFFGIYFLLLFIVLHIKNRKTLYDYPKPKTFPFISIIVPAYNEEDSIAKSIQGHLELDYPKNKKEIIVVNDGSKDNTEKIVKELTKKYKEIKLLNKENSGKADSINKAIEIAKGELIVVADADSMPAKDTLMKMIGYFEEDEKVAAVTSRVLVKNTRNFLEKYQAFDYIVIAWSRKILDYLDSVYVTNGPFSVYRKRSIQEVGGFDPKNMTEDIEITWNLLSKGYKTKMSYSTEVYTIVPPKLSQWIKQRIRWNVGGMQTLGKYKKHFFRGENLFGYFVMTYVSLSFLLAVVGLLLSFRWIVMRFLFYIRIVPLLFSGYNPFQFIEINMTFGFILIFGIMFLILAIIYYELAVKNSELKSKNILNILIYTFLYRTLYMIPLVLALFKYVKGDVRWYTK